MPIFEYICKECSGEFEVIVQGSQEVACPSCESTELEKKFSAFAVMNNGPLASPCRESEACASCCDAGPGGSCPLN